MSSGFTFNYFKIFFGNCLITIILLCFFFLLRAESVKTLYEGRVCICGLSGTGAEISIIVILL